MTYKDLCEKNPKLKIHRVEESCFQAYGRVFTQYDLEELYEWYGHTGVSSAESEYKKSDLKIEEMQVIKEIASDIYGGLSIQAGPCYGKNKSLKGIEYHMGSEVTITLKPCVMFLGKLQDILFHHYHGSKADCFYLDKGLVVQTYETTLHYTPCSQDDFFNICMLLKGTGDLLDDGRRGILKKKNKWFIAHTSNNEKIKEGDYPGLTGDIRVII